MSAYSSVRLSGVQSSRREAEWHQRHARVECLAEETVKPESAVN